MFFELEFHKVILWVTCINCNQEISGNFCQNCSQRASVKRITFKEGWYDFWARIYGFDGMFPRTLRDLTIRPGVAARRFIDGNRAAYYGPVGYFFLMITVMLLLFDLMGITFVDLMRNTQQALAPTASDRQAAFSLKFQAMVADNIKLFFFCWIPFQALSARFIFFRKSGLNFMEHTVLPLFVMGHGLWVTIVMGIIFAITGTVYNIAVVISIAYYGLGYATLMTYQSPVKAFFKGLGVWLTGYLLFTLAFMLVLLAVIAIAGLANPDALKEWFNS